MSNRSIFRNWINFSKIILRKCRLKKFSIILIILVVYLIFNKLVHFYFLFKCWKLKFEALNQICRSYFDEEYVGLSCKKFCVERSIELIDCPNMLYHKGKDYVFNVRDRTGQEYILKSRETHLPTKHFTKDLLIHSIEQLVSEVFKDEFDLKEINSLIYLNEPINMTNLNTQEFNKLANLYNLLQDNEYTLSMVLNNVNRFKSFKTLPSISMNLATCGNWYIVDKVHSIIDHNYLDRTVYTRKQKMFIGHKLMQFLSNFESLNISLELCDAKYEHFGFDGQLTNDSDLVLIDSDMIYHTLNVQSNIGAIQNCEQNDDCDFVDCKGVCKRSNNGTSVCSLNAKDNNLKRICRNLFFIEPFKLNELYDTGSLGLLVNLEASIEPKILQIYKLCFEDDLINVKSNQVYSLDERVKSISSLIRQMLSF